MENKPKHTTIAAGLLFAVFLWGANNAGTKYVLKFWPPMFTGSTRFLTAGVILCALLRWTRWFGATHPVSRGLARQLWWRGGLSLAAYIFVFNSALKLTTVSHVALYLGASPVWALLWEGVPERNWKSAQRYGAAALAFGGVLVLLWPALHKGSSSLPGELLGIASSVLWTNFGRQCRVLGRDLTGAEVSAHAFWRAGLILAPFSVIEICAHGVTRSPNLASVIGVQLFCVLGGSVVAFAIWNGALRHWKTSQVYLFNNLVPISSTTWAHFCLNEPMTKTFWVAMLLIGTGVCLGQANYKSSNSKVRSLEWAE